MNTIETTNPHRTAKIAGLLYLLLVPLGVFGILYVPNALVIPGDAVMTAHNILENESLFRLSIVSALLTQVVNLFVVAYLYRLFKPVNRNYAAMMVIFILVAVPIAMLNELSNIAILLLLGGNDHLTAFTTDQINTLVPMFLELHEYGIHIAGIFWGLWLLPMGLLVYKSNFIPKFIGIFLVVGCIGYVLDSVITLMYPGFGIVISEYTFLGEIMILLWLLIKGVNVEQWEKQALSDTRS